MTPCLLSKSQVNGPRAHLIVLRSGRGEWRPQGPCTSFHFPTGIISCQDLKSSHDSRDILLSAGNRLTRGEGRGTAGPLTQKQTCRHLKFTIFLPEEVNSLERTRAPAAWPPPTGTTPSAGPEQGQPREPAEPLKKNARPWSVNYAPRRFTFP